MKTSNILLRLTDQNFGGLMDWEKQHLYNIQVKLQRKEVSNVNQHIGIRKIELTADSTLSQPNFYFKVNGSPTFAKRCGVTFLRTSSCLE